MAIILRFRPIVLGPIENPGTVLYLVEGPDGHALFREREFVWPLAMPLHSVTSEDLPEPYRGEDVTILPVQEVAGKSRVDAHRRMTSVLEKLSTRGEERRSA